MSSSSVLIGGYGGLLGLAIGIIVSGAALEEVDGYARAFRLMRDFSFLLAAGLFLFQAGVVVLVIGLFLLAVVLKEFDQRDASNAIILMHMVLLILTLGTPLFHWAAGLLVIIGLLEAGRWSAQHKDAVGKGSLLASTWRRLLADHVLYVVLPLAGLVFLV